MSIPGSARLSTTVRIRISIPAWPVVIILLGFLDECQQHFPPLRVKQRSAPAHRTITTNTSTIISTTPHPKLRRRPVLIKQPYDCLRLRRKPVLTITTTTTALTTALRRHNTPAQPVPHLSAHVISVPARPVVITKARLARLCNIISLLLPVIFSLH